jgi:hypothetical protein
MLLINVFLLLGVLSLFFIPLNSFGWIPIAIFMILATLSFIKWAIKEDAKTIKEEK